MDGETFEFERPLSAPVRLLLGVAGLICILAATLELGDGILQIGWWTPFFAAIVLGAWCVGGAFVAAAIMGEAQRWQFRDGELVLSRRSLLKYATQTVRGHDVEGTEIREVEWDSQANTFSVVLRLKSGGEFETPDYDTRIAAEAMQARMARALGLSVGGATG